MNLFNFLEARPCCLKSLYENTRKNNNHHAKKIGALDQRHARGSVAGCVYYRGDLCISKLSLKYPEIDDLLLKFMNHHNPNFTFSSVYITKNCQSRPHCDGNPGNSIIISVGNYTGGGLVIEQEPNVHHIFNIKDVSLEFDGSKYRHWTQDFTGTRYTFIFY